MPRRARGAIVAVAIAALITAGLVVGRSGREALPPLEVMAQIGSFELIDQDGEVFSSTRLDGHVWVVGFFFTQCPSVCPMLTAAMTNLQRRLASHGDAFQLVSVSVDPQTDTPERLRAYAARQGADLRNWSFLTGEPAEVRTTLSRTFLVPVGDRQEIDDDGNYDILHTARLMLIDQQGRLRGLYGTDAEGLSEIERDVARLRAAP